MKSLLLAIALLCTIASLGRGQDPSRDYLTIATTHFRVSFTRPLEPVARRVAADAERAYAQLSASLHPPRGTIDVLVTDDFDFSNGSATPSPTNRIIVYAMPPVTDYSLRYTTDWAQMVVTHELTHIFQLDRVRGVWRLGQYVFGRSPFLFPNSYQPSWLIEGLAVYEESRLAGQGRIQGPEHELITHAVLRDRGAPSIGNASLALPTFPQGSAAYVFGSLFVDYLARTRGDSALRRFVESSSAQLVPYLIDIPARRAFGVSFSRAWREWLTSLDSSVAPSTVPTYWKPLTGPMLQAGSPRWADTGTISFTGTTGREVLSAWSVSTGGELRNLGVRNGMSPTVVLPNGDRVFAQYEYDGPYRYRSDLFIDHDGSVRRLTSGERLFAPDANAAGDLIAMQVVEGATRLVRVSESGNVSPITRAHLDTLWSEPRWSHRGDRIVASRWLRGGVAQIVVLDSSGREQRVVASARAVLAAPSWGWRDTAIVFTNDGSQRSVRPDGAPVAGNYDPSYATLEIEQRDPQTTAGILLRGDGYHVALGTVGVLQADGSDALRDTAPDPHLPSLAIDTSTARSYNGIAQLRPHYWAPLAEQGFDGAYLLGGYTEAWDILRRHYVYADARIPTDNSGIGWSAEYEYRGFGLPVVATSVSQDWTPFAIFDRSSGNRVGTLRRRVTDGDLLTTFVRQRIRSSLSLSIGAGMERRDYRGDPPAILRAVDTTGAFNPATFPRVSASMSYARYYSPAFSISPEDGFTVAVTARERLKSGFNALGGASTSIVGSSSLYKALDLPGYAHHVIAMRGSAGWADTRANSYFDVGGVSGGTYQVFPGYTVGEGRRTFPVRGFAPGTGQGIRAATASIEYRAPLVLTQRSISTLPAFLQRSSLTLFGDYGTAWCPSTLTTRQVCVDPSQEVKTNMASVGGEVSVAAGLLSWDSPTRLRLGLALPVLNGAALGAKSLTVYFTTGLSF